MPEENTIQRQSNLIKSILSMSNLGKITASDERIHNAFYKLKNEFPEYFEGLMFNINRSFPQSNDLYDIWGSYKLTGILTWNNIFCKNYDIQITKGQIEAPFKDNPNDINQIKEITKKFVEYIQ